MIAQTGWKQNKMSALVLFKNCRPDFQAQENTTRGVDMGERYYFRRNLR